MWHGDKRICQKCSFEMRSLKPELVSWFRELKKRFINTHIQEQHGDCVKLFQIDEDGVERSTGPFYKMVDSLNKTDKISIHWDGSQWFRLKP